MVNARVWLCYDLGIRGDYESLFTWLDNNQAKECGDGLAVFKYEYDEDLLEELGQDLQDNMEVTRRTRIYVVFGSGDGRAIGKFLIGKRKGAPWEGQGSDAEDEVDL